MAPYFRDSETLSRSLALSFSLLRSTDYMDGLLAVNITISSTSTTITEIDSGARKQ